MQGDMKLDGLQAYIAQLNQAAQRIDPAADKAVQAGGKVVFDEMLRQVPVRTGALKAHLGRTGKTEVQHEGNMPFVEIGLLDLGPADAGYGKTGKRARKKTYHRQFLYGVILEYGKSNMAAQPYIRPAFDNSRAKVREAEIAVLKAEGLL